MTVTDEMVEAFSETFYGESLAEYNPLYLELVRKSIKAALETIQPMTSREIDSMMHRGCIDDTVDLVEAVEYWHGIRE
jgi:hypothetical protein